MKAILVLDEMPCACVECPFCVHAKFDYYFDKTICIANGDKILDTSKAQRMCPLKEMPEKIKGKYTLTGIETIDSGYVNGWNACIEELEK